MQEILQNVVNLNTSRLFPTTDFHKLMLYSENWRRFTKQT